MKNTAGYLFTLIAKLPPYLRVRLYEEEGQLVFDIMEDAPASGWRTRLEMLRWGSPRDDKMHAPGDPPTRRQASSPAYRGGVNHSDVATFTVAVVEYLEDFIERRLPAIIRWREEIDRAESP